MVTVDSLADHAHVPGLSLAVDELELPQVPDVVVVKQREVDRCEPMLLHNTLLVLDLEVRNEKRDIAVACHDFLSEGQQDDRQARLLGVLI